MYRETWCNSSSESLLYRHQIVNKNLKGIGIIRDVTEEVKAENIEKEVRRKKLEYKQKNDFFLW